MLIVAIVIALMLDALAVWGAIKLFDRSDSVVLRTFAITSAIGTIVGTALVASLATTGVRTMIVMEAMSRREPTATILASDREMHGKIETAVRRGLDKPSGGMVENVKSEVEGVLRPYMAYRMSHAPDASVVASARDTLRMLEKARAEGPETCSAVLRGDRETVLRLSGSDQGAWLPEMLKTEADDSPERADAQELSAFVQTVAREAGVTPEDMRRASSDRTGPAACTFPIAAISRAVSLPQDRGAAVLRALGIGGTVS